MRGDRSKKIVDFDGHAVRSDRRGPTTTSGQKSRPLEDDGVREFSLTHGSSLDKYSQKTLEDLIVEVAAGDRLAFEQLFERVTPRIKGYLMRMGAGEGQAEEITQDVMVSVWRRARTYDLEKAAATTWLYQIARNRRIDLWRREHKLILDPHEPLLQGNEPDQPYQLLNAAEEAARVREAIEQLPDELSRLLRLAYYDGLTHQEIANATGLPLGTAKSRIRKATKIVRNTLDPEAD